MARKHKSKHIWTVCPELEAPNRKCAKTAPGQVSEGQLRRRIEDIQEGLRIEREALDEIWD